MSDDPIDPKAVLAALKGVQDPELGRDLVDLGMIRDVRIEGVKVELTLVLTTPGCPLKAKMEAQVRQAILARLPGVEQVSVRFDAAARPGGHPRGPASLPGIHHVVLVGSGKGGVGKSTVSANLALSLSRLGGRVGLLDADIYGPNIPTMLGHGATALEFRGERAVPPERHGVRFFSMGFMLRPDQAVIWRGPMLHSAVQQLISDIDWGELDYLLIDLPPGTGDVQISLAQTVVVSGAVVVSTPQEVALGDVRKGISMFRQMEIPILGLVENMGAFLCPHCGKATEVFLEGGVGRLATELKIPFLGSIPLDRRICAGGDAGLPIVAAEPESLVAATFVQIARRLTTEVSAAAHGHGSCCH